MLRAFAAPTTSAVATRATISRASGNKPPATSAPHVAVTITSPARLGFVSSTMAPSGTAFDGESRRAREGTRESAKSFRRKTRVSLVAPCHFGGRRPGGPDASRRFPVGWQLSSVALGVILRPGYGEPHALRPDACRGCAFGAGNDAHQRRGIGRRRQEGGVRNGQRHRRRCAARRRARL